MTEKAGCPGCGRQHSPPGWKLWLECLCGLRLEAVRLSTTTWGWILGVQPTGRDC